MKPIHLQSSAFLDMLNEADMALSRKISAENEQELLGLLDPSLDVMEILLKK
jgi:hypothetical protein